MRNILCGILGLCLLGTGCLSGLFTKFATREWKNAYREILTQKLAEFQKEYPDGTDDLDTPYFSLYDLNGDNTPELIVSPGTYHAAQCEIYTVTPQNGLVCVDEAAGAFGGIQYLPNLRLVEEYNIGQGYETVVYSKMECDGLQEIARFENDAGAREDATYMVDGEKMSEKDYKAQLTQYKDADGISLGNDFRIDCIDVLKDEE